MNKNPLISVLLPLYNEPISLAKQAIDSILNQTFSHLEVILLLDNPQNTELINLIQDYEGKEHQTAPIESSAHHLYSLWHVRQYHDSTMYIQYLKQLP
jgi:glycosyltransferase involved in cell wall biosynthesis